MQVPALPLDHPLLGRVERSGRHELIERSDDDAEITVRIEAIKLAHEGDETNFRPYVRIRGELLGIKPQRRLPGAVSEIAYPEGGGLSVDAKCAFSDEQIAHMIRDGYFEPGYGFVDGVVGESIVLNAPTNFKISRAFEEDTLDVPIVFVDVPDRANLEYEPDMSGYDFTEYLKVPEKQVDLERVAEKSFDVEHDLFAELHEQFDRENDGAVPRFEAETPSLSAGDEFDRAREETLRRVAEASPKVEEPEEDSVRLFRESIAGSLDEAMPRRVVEASEEADSTPAHLLDEADPFLEQQEARARLSSNTIDLGDAGIALGIERPVVPEPTLVEEVSVEVGSDSWLFSDAEEEDEDEIEEPQVFGEVESDHEGESDDVELDPEHAGAGRPAQEGSTPEVADPTSSESQSRVAKILAAHAERERVAQEARRMHVNEKDISPQT